MDRREAILLGATGALGMLAFGGCKEQPEKSGLSKTDNSSKMKTIGILGGFGPQATMDFEKRIHAVAQKLIPQKQNSGYPPMVVFFQRHPPVLLKEDKTPILPLQADPRLLEAAKRLGTLADFIVIPSNTPHNFQKEIEAAAGKKLLSMVDLTLDEVKKRNWQKVGVFGFGKPTVYTNRLTEMNIAFETIDDTTRARIDKAVMKVMEGRNDGEDGKAAYAAIEQLRALKVDGIIIGCTEIPIMLEPMEVATSAIPGSLEPITLSTPVIPGWSVSIHIDDTLNPAQILAEAAVRFAME